MSVSTIVDELYRNISEIICHEVCSEICTCKCTCSLNVSLKASCKKDVLPNLFYSVLDDIAMYISGDTGVKHGSYCEYYKDADIIRWDKLIAKIQKYAQTWILKCSHSNNSHNELVSATHNYISGIVTRKLISEVIYYKENHSAYERSLWKGYSEVIEKCFYDNEARLTKREFTRIRGITEKITAEAVSSVYKSIYGKQTVEITPPSFSRFAGSLKCNYISCCIADFNFDRKKKEQPWYKECSYYSTIKEVIREDSFVSLSACYNMLCSSSVPFSKNTYLALVREHIPKLIGIDKKISLYMKRSNNGRYIQRNYIEAFNKAVLSAHELFSKRGKSYSLESRFQLIQSLNDLECYHGIVKTYLSVMSLFLDEEQFDTLFEIGSNDSAEINVIMSAAEKYFEIIQPKAI